MAFVVTAVVTTVTVGIYLIVMLVRALGAAATRKRKAQVVRAAPNTLGSELHSPGHSTGELAAVPPALDGPAAYHEVHQVPEDTFESPEKAEGEARLVFVDWVRRLPGAPRDASDRIEQVTASKTLVGRLVTTFEGRRLMWRTRGGAARDVGLTPAIDISKVDPWAPPANLDALTRHAKTCPRCIGLGRVECGRCGGAGLVGCGECHGARKYYQTASNGSSRLMNCRGCRASGAVTCGGCSLGRVECRSCDGQGRLVAWLEVDESAREDVQVEPDGDVTRAFWWGSDGVSASDDDVRSDANEICSVEHAGPLSETRLPGEVPTAWRESHWQGLQPSMQPGERITRQRFALLEVPSVDVVYSVGNVRQTVAFEGLRMLAPPASDERAFAQRASTLRAAMYGLIAFPLVLGGVYLARGEWFLSPAVALVIGSAAVAAALAYVALWNATLPRRGAWSWLTGAVGAVGAGAVFAFGAEPDIDNARQALAAGDLERAAFEVAAVDDGRGDPEVARIKRQIALKRVLDTDDVTRAANLLAPLTDGDEYARGLKHVDGLRWKEVERYLENQDFDEARRWFGALSDTARSSPEGEALRERIETSFDRWTLNRAQSALTRGEGAEAQRALNAAREAARSTPESRALGGRIALMVGEDALNKKSWANGFDAADRAESFGLATEADALRQRLFAALDRYTEELLAAARAEKELEARITVSRKAEAMLVESVQRRQSAEPPELVKLRKQLATDVGALEKKRAAEEKRRIEAERKAAAAKAAAERKAEQQRLREAQREAARARAMTYEYRSSGPRCVRGCPCGNSCISCSKRCRR